MAYTFKKADEDSIKGGALIMTVECEAPLFPGKAIALFGVPDYYTDDYEHVFSMAVSAESESGELFLLRIYQGPEGPSIGGSVEAGEIGEAEKAAAAELAGLLLAAEPEDYDWEGDCTKRAHEGDITVHIKMGIKNGDPYFDEIMPEDYEFEV